MAAADSAHCGPVSPTASWILGSPQASPKPGDWDAREHTVSTGLWQGQASCSASHPMCPPHPSRGGDSEKAEPSVAAAAPLGHHAMLGFPSSPYDLHSRAPKATGATAVHPTGPTRSRTLQAPLPPAPAGPSLVSRVSPGSGGQAGTRHPASPLRQLNGQETASPLSPTRSQRPWPHPTRWGGQQPPGGSCPWTCDTRTRMPRHSEKTRSLK